MGVPLLDCYKHGALLAKCVLVLLAFACVLVWVAFISTEWIHTGTGRHHGLWLACYRQTDSTKCQAEYGGPYWDRWAVVQATATSGFLGINAALVLTILYIFMDRLKHNDDVAALIVSVCVGTGFLYLFGMLVIMMDFTSEFVKDFNQHPIWTRPKPGYCYYCSWTAIFLSLLAGVLILKDSTNRRRAMHKLARSQWMELKSI